MIYNGANMYNSSLLSDLRGRFQIAIDRDSKSTFLSILVGIKHPLIRSELSCQILQVWRCTAAVGREHVQIQCGEQISIMNLRK